MYCQTTAVLDLRASPRQHTYQVLEVAARRIPLLLIGGTLDAVAPVNEVEWLAADNGWGLRMFESGHNVPAELPLQWRRSVLEHFS